MVTGAFEGPNIGVCGRMYGAGSEALVAVGADDFADAGVRLRDVSGCD